MGEESSNAVAIPRSSATSSLSVRFLGLLKQPDDSDLDPNLTVNSALELDESDVVWSSSDNSSPSSVSSPVTTSPEPVRRTSRAFVPGSFGLSALLESTSPGSGPGPLRRQSSPITPPVAVPFARPSPPSRKAFNQSAPMAVPMWPGRRREGRKGREEAWDDMWGLEEEEGTDEIEEDGMEEMVPPHLIVARSQSHISSFSVLEGAGRTLKGRDLCRVRNAVLQKTGFLDVKLLPNEFPGACVYVLSSGMNYCDWLVASLTPNPVQQLWIYTIWQHGKLPRVMLQSVTSTCPLNLTNVIGGLIFAMASKDEGKIHNPSPQIKPDATAGIINVARLELILCQTNTIKVPMHISIAKLAPIRKGAAMAIGSGTHLPYLDGKRSLIRFATTANPKNP